MIMQPDGKFRDESIDLTNIKEDKNEINFWFSRVLKLYYFTSLNIQNLITFDKRR